MIDLMEKVNYALRVELLTKKIISKIKDMEKENDYIVMDLLIKEIIKMI